MEHVITCNSLPHDGPAKHLAGFPRINAVPQYTVMQELTSMHIYLQQWKIKEDHAA